MVGVELLYDLIQTSNAEVLDFYNVTLDETNLRFTELYAGEYQDGTNTTLMGTAFGTKIEGSQIYYYKRLDLTQAFLDIGAEDVTIEFEEDSEPDFGAILFALRRKYNLPLDYEEVKSLVVEDNVVTIIPIDQSYVWVGELKVRIVITGEVLELAAQFPNNVLNGLTTIYQDPLTDGGNYDQLVGTSPT